MQFSTKRDRIAWNQLNMPEQLVMLAMLAGPQRDVEWLIQRALCFHKVAVITPQGLRMTRLGRLVMAERHGLPVVIGRDPADKPMAVLG
ncbi:hypothetical protein SAMN05216456_3298 [Devosia crocina]|uniref:Uncharacterized protein n=1 Tax=Devosia crocina TaxID=429728 RepID=A0A1I7NUH0_9HYPH|nr:hypothetical protein [Devosia crocina]SFV38291.1 hypothetical protein SAMN05216456_3298 [Devosia crocina]